MNLKKLQKVISAIGHGLPPKDDWMPALIMEGKKEATVFGFVGDPMGGEQSKNRVAAQITECIAKFKPDCACFITTAWSLNTEAKGVSELDLELYRAGAIKISEHPARIEIVNAYVYGVRGPNEGEALMVGTIERFKDKGPRIKRWRIMTDDVTAEGRFPDAVREGFRKAKEGG